jgi:hypothetical protein
MAKIICENCNKVIADHDDPAEAEEDACVANAHHDRYAGIWVCEPCADAAMAEAMRDMPVYAAEEALRDRQTAEDDYLALGDLARDAASEDDY